MRFSVPVAARFTRTALAAGLLLVLAAPPADAQFTWNVAIGGSWNTAANWNPPPPIVPNAVGASVTFNGVATASNPAQTANRTIALDAAQTVGSIVFNNDLSTFTNTIGAGTSGTLTFDETGSGPATITTMGTGTGNNTISAPLVLNDSITVIVNQTTASSGAGSITFTTGGISGGGGFTKQGPGMMTFANVAKTYTGPTVLDTNSGRTRISLAGAPTGTSSFTVRSGAQIDPISAGTYTLGTGPLNLNGTGLGAGSVPGNFPGAIRQDTNLAITITNPVVLQSDTLLHVQGSATGALTLPGAVSGPGSLTLTAPNSDANLGKLTLTGTNSYTGGTTVRGGLLEAGGTNALGTGNVTVLSGNDMFAGASARLAILPGAVDAIADTATLSLAGGGSAVTADDGFVSLGAGVNEVVGALVLGGVTQATNTTYGATGSGAANIMDEYFTGPGIITVAPVPEPGAVLAVGVAGLGLTGLVRRRRSKAWPDHPTS